MSPNNSLLQSKLQQLLPQENMGGDKKPAIRTSILKIINNTIVFENTVYQIRNICDVELADLTKKYPVPTWYWFILVFGLITIPLGVGIFILIFVVWLFWRHSQKRIQEKYGLKIGMNSGEGVIIVSKNKEFILQIIVTIHDIMNNDEPKSIEFNFETFQDRSITIGQAHGSTLISGQITGDVVNRV
ncbi:MAG TPA: hypothetical protein IGS52_12575 [Oscillatoriaceae cyanobacterium M33_DOE_052]|uniref:Uncharacterized protein n=1 Tax=Planktothricoides sp. SpSt-374 TaxID=2282167 RepID=A0A7C3ZJQ6_9CYAN|nr:hypothetical protein [Oscillatoriaceae cyanobacterium M33_DOE_052]